MKRTIRHAYMPYMILHKNCRKWRRLACEGTGATDIEAVNCLLERLVQSLRNKSPRGIHYLRDIEICDATIEFHNDSMGCADILTRPVFPCVSDNPTTHPKPENVGVPYVRS